MASSYDPFKFIKEVEIITIALVGSFITMKFLNALYENIYEPTIDICVDSEKADKYYLKVGKYYIQAGNIVKEIIKWLLLIVILMLLYNWLVKKKN